MLRHAFPAVAACALMACGDRSPTRPMGPAQVAGCYELRWEKAGRVIRNAVTVPDSVRLDTAVACPRCDGERRDARRRIEPLGTLPPAGGPGDPVAWQRAYAGKTWRSLGRDSVEIAFADSWTSYVLRLRADGRNLAGSATFHSDAKEAAPPQPSFHVTGRRIACPTTSP